MSADGRFLKSSQNRLRAVLGAGTVDLTMAMENALFVIGEWGH